MAALEKKIVAFLSTGSGDGYGYGSGDGYGYGSGDGYGYGFGSGAGYGDGYGYGSGDGYGYGYGDGSGDGYGDGYGYGYGAGSGAGFGSGYGAGLKSFNGYRVYYIDDTPTIIYDVIGNNARCAVVQRDLTLEPCYVAKVYNFFAHGDTLHDAMKAAQEKYDNNKPLEERIADFIAKYPTLDTVATNKDLFVAHHTLTGSCLFGRQQFAKEHDIDVENGTMTVREFIKFTNDAYGKDAIRKLEEAYK
jgi:hypothetical protein